MSSGALPNIYRFYDKTTHDIIENVVQINLSSNGVIESITTSDGQVLNTDDFIYTNLVLEVPGLGYALCGDLITIKVKTKISNYILGFGWHLNISNQMIYSWYLLPNDKKGLLNKPDSEFEVAKTLYYNDLISIIAITNQMSYDIPTDISNNE